MDFFYWIWCKLALIAYLGDCDLDDWIGIVKKAIKAKQLQIQSSIFNHLKVIRNQKSSYVLPVLL